MKKWVSGIRGTVVMIVLWIVGWGVGFGGLIEAFVDPHGEIVDIWPALMGINGFIGGVVISGVLRVAEGRRSFDEVSLVRFATCGIVSGVVVGALAVSIGLADDIAIDTPQRMPIAPLVLIGITTALALVAAIGSSVFFRLVARRQTPAAAGRQA